MTRLFIFAVLVFLMASCGNQAKKTTDDTAATEATVATLLEDASLYVDQVVEVEGTVVHVCRHGGQRLFIVGPDSEERIRVTTGDNISEFKIELEGSVIEVTGTVRELIIDEAYLAEWEAEILEGASEHEPGEGHESVMEHMNAETGEHAEGEHAAEMDPEARNEAILQNIQSIRDEIAASGKDHLSDYWIEAISFEVRDADEADDEEMNAVEDDEGGEGSGEAASHE